MRLIPCTPPAQVPIIIDDAMLDHLAGVYQANPVFGRYRISFEFFLVNGPLACARSAAQSAENEVDVLFQQQRTERLLDAAGCTVHDGRWVEKMRHRVWPRKADQRRRA